MDQNYTIDKFEKTQISVGIITGILSILPTLLYILFLWKLWFFFGKVFGKNKYRFRYDDFKVLRISSVNSLNDPHYMKLPKQDRIILIHHIVAIFLTTILIGGFCSQFLSIKWTAPLTLKPGDFLLTNTTGSVLECNGRLEYSLYYSPSTHVDPIPFHNRISYTNISCLDTILFYSTHLKKYNYEQQIYIADVEQIGYLDLWLPKGSYMHNISKCFQKITMAGNAVPFPCYIPSENIYTSQADELCHHYAHNFAGSPDYDMVVNNSVCNENRTICSTM